MLTCWNLLPWPADEVIFIVAWNVCCGSVLGGVVGGVGKESQYADEIIRIAALIRLVIRGARMAVAPRPHDGLARSHFLGSHRVLCLPSPKSPNSACTGVADPAETNGSVLGGGPVTLVVRPQSQAEEEMYHAGGSVKSPGDVVDQHWCWACSATRSLYAEQNRPTGRIAFVSGNFGDSGNRKIYLMNPDGSDVRPLTETEGEPGEDRPSWSPDSTSIAFAARNTFAFAA